jgi:hypothetical protein
MNLESLKVEFNPAKITKLASPITELGSEANQGSLKK